MGMPLGRAKNSEGELYDRAVTPEFRSWLHERYPALQVGRKAEAYRRILQYVLFSSFLDEDTGFQVLPATTVARLVGRAPGSGGFSAWSELMVFSERVLDLRVNPHDKGQARTIDPALSEELRTRLLEELSARRKRRCGEGLVYFVSGAKVTRNSVETAQREYRHYLDDLVEHPRADHPALPLLNLLNHNRGDSLRAIVNRNWDAMMAYADSLPIDTPEQFQQRLYAERCLNAIAEHGVVMRYADSPKTDRIFALGINLNTLPRELRKLALRGTVALDLAAAQLAIVSLLYGCSRLGGFLASGRSFWTEMLTYLGLGDEHKPILKDTIYAITFGMRTENFQTLLAQGVIKKGKRIIRMCSGEGIGSKLAGKFFRHPLVADLVEGRQRAIAKVYGQGYAEDAWQVKHPLEGGRHHVPSLLARVAQSYEVRIMLAMVPIIERNSGVQIVSFIHDGVYLHFTRERDNETLLRKIKTVVSEEAASLGIPTQFDP